MARHAGTLSGAAGQSFAYDLHLPDTPPPHPLLVVCHGFKGFKDWGFFPTLAEDVAAERCAVLRFNFSHNGVSPGDDGAEFRRLDLFEQDRMSYRLHDLHRVFQALAEGKVAGGEDLDRERVALFGHSLGGAVVLLMVEDLPVKAVATLASVDRVALSPEQSTALREWGRILIPNARTGQMMPLGIAALKDIEANGYDLDDAAAHGLPWLLVHGTDDPTVPVAAAERLNSLAAPGTSELVLVDGADHVMGCRHPFAGRTPHYEHFRRRLTTFLSDVL